MHERVEACRKEISTGDTFVEAQRRAAGQELFSFEKKDQSRILSRDLLQSTRPILLEAWYFLCDVRLGSFDQSVLCVYIVYTGVYITPQGRCSHFVTALDASTKLFVVVH